MERAFLLWLQEIRNPVLDWIMRFFSILGDYGIFPAAVVCVLLIIPKTRKSGIICGISLLMALILNNLILKNLFHRVRPYVLIEGLTTIVRRPYDWSFPSGHTAMAFSLASAFFLNVKKTAGIPALITAFFVGFSRMYCGVHFPSDVLGGMIVGLMSGGLAFLILKKTEEKKGSYF